ncbi:MAG: NAD+ synthase [Promethearchaeota archaeon]
MNPTINYPEIEEKITKWLRQQLEKSECTGFVIGISGGIDSSVASVLCRRVTDATLGLILPCGYSSAEDIDDAKALASHFGIEFRVYDLTPVYEIFLSSLGLQANTPISIPLANIKARLRMVALYYESNRLNRLVVGTGNRTELTLGFFTKFGDGGVDLVPLGGLLKREIRGLAEYLGIPEKIISKTPSPGLWPGQTDEGELGASYDQLDALISGETPQDLTNAEIKKFKKRIADNQHKRQLPPVGPR